MKMVFIPLHTAAVNNWLPRLRDAHPTVEFVAPADVAETVTALAGARAAFACGRFTPVMKVTG